MRRPMRSTLGSRCTWAGLSAAHGRVDITQMPLIASSANWEMLASLGAEGLESTTGSGWYEGFITNAMWRLAPPEDSRLVGATASEPPEQILKRLEQQCNEAWDQFPELAGTHLKLRQVSSRGWELTRSEDALALASSKGASGAIPAQVEISGATYKRSRTFHIWQSYQWLNVETRASILRGAGLNFDHRARMAMELPDGRRFRFPVRGTSLANAVMTAVDDKGDRIARFRSARGSGFEVVVAPHVPITTELLLIVAASSPAVFLYFKVWSSGGS